MTLLILPVSDQIAAAIATTLSFYETRIFTPLKFNATLISATL